MYSKYKKKKNILITGSTGLIGSKFFDIYSKKYNIYKIHYNNDIKTYKYDLSKIQTFKKIPSKFEVLIYLAQSNNYSNPRKFKKEIININYKNFKNLVLKLNEGKKLKKVIYASSGSVYLNEGKKIREISKLNINTNNVYVKSKLMSENFLLKFKEKHFEFFIARIFFAYGKKQKENMLMKNLIFKIKNNQSIYLNGTTGIKINPIHVVDVCKIFDKSINKNVHGIFNVAGPEILTIKDICNKIGKKLKLKVNFTYDNKSKNLIANIDKLQNLYSPKNSFNNFFIELI